MNISVQDANDSGIIAISVVASWISVNVFQIIPAVAAVVSMIFMIKRYYDDKKKQDLETELLKMQLAEAKKFNRKLN